VEDMCSEILGAWKLVYSKAISTDGEESFPFGTDAIGYIYYSNTNIMAVQISRKVHGSTANSNDYLAYFGRYEVDQDRKVIKHFIEGQLSTGQFAELEERQYELKGNRLFLRPVANPTHEILWEKVSS
jgi:hypothetical protein